MISRTREEKYLHRGSVDRVIRSGNINDCVDPLLVILPQQFLEKKRTSS